LHPGAAPSAHYRSILVHQQVCSLRLLLTTMHSNDVKPKEEDAAPSQAMNTPLNSGMRDKAFDYS
jgi:hypothetical protein